MKKVDRTKLIAELKRLEEITGPVHVHCCCPICNEVTVTHVSTGLCRSSHTKATPIENHLVALRDLASSLRN